MDLKELEIILKNDTGINFIAYGNTVLQACGIDATILYLKSKGINLNGYVLMGAHGVTGRLLNEDKFVAKDKGIKYENLDIEYEQKSFISRLTTRVKQVNQKSDDKAKIVYVVRTFLDSEWYGWLSEVLPDCKLIYITIDDGSATYESPFFGVARYTLNNSKSILNTLKLPINIVKTVYRLSFLKRWRKNLEKNGSYICNYIFSKCKKNGSYEYVRNEEMAKFYSEIFKRSSETIDDEIKNKFSDVILINTQCFKENGLTDGVVDFEVIRRTVDLANKYNCPIVLKPHPRDMEIEKFYDLNCQVVNEKMSQEVLLATIKKKPKCIISIYSSLLFNAIGLFDVPAISLVRILMRENVTDNFRAKLNDYYQCYKDIIYFPETFEELDELLKEMIGRGENE